MSTPYLSFLSELAQNNSKEWMDANKARYQEVKSAFLDDVRDILFALAEWEPGLAMLEPKQCVFRQNRDVRFSKNKDPYKNNMGAYFSVGGKKSDNPGYYLHLQPGASFIAGGLWMPQPAILKAIRQEIDYSGAELAAILADKKFKARFPELKGEQLKTTPKGFAADHPHLDLLRYKSFIVSTPLDDAAINNRAFVAKALESFKAMKPLVDYLQRGVDEGQGEE